MASAVPVVWATRPTVLPGKARGLLAWMRRRPDVDAMATDVARSSIPGRHRTECSSH